MRKSYRKSPNVFMARVAAISDKEQKLFWTFLSMTVFLFILHIYFVVSMAVLAADQDHIHKDTVAMRSTIGELESTYLEKSKGIDMAYAEGLGYNEPGHIVFAKTTSFVSLANDGHEI